MAQTSRKMTMAIVLMVVVVAISSWTPTNASGTVADLPCVQSLIPCISYIGNNNPPASCCVPLREAYQTQKDCLCTLFNDPDLRAAAGDPTQVLQLPKNCGIDADFSVVCNKVAQAPASGPATSVPTESPPADVSVASKIAAVSGMVVLMVGFIHNL